MFDDCDDRTASLMTPTRLAQIQARPGPAPTSAAWLDQLADSAGSGHVRRLQDLRHQLAALLGAGDVQGILGSCQAWQEALAQLEVSLAQPRGWLARLTGGGREDQARFAEQLGRALQSGEAFAAALRTLQKDQQAQRTAVERTLHDCEGELRAIEKIIGQAARWLQDMRREGDADPAEPARPHEQEARCDLLVARLELLRSASAAAQQLLQHGRSACGARQALAARWQQVLDDERTAWRQQAAALAGAEETRTAIETARRAQTQLQAALLAAAGDARHVRAQDQALHGELAALQASLQAAA